MDELVFPLFLVIPVAEAAEQINHEPRHARAEPDVAVCYPYYIAFCFAVGTAHVADLGVWSQVAFFAILWEEIRVFFFNEDSCVEGGEVG